MHPSLFTIFFPSPVHHQVWAGGPLSGRPLLEPYLLNQASLFPALAGAMSSLIFPVPPLAHVHRENREAGVRITKCHRDRNKKEFKVPMDNHLLVEACGPPSTFFLPFISPPPCRPLRQSNLCNLPCLNPRENSENIARKDLWIVSPALNYPLESERVKLNNNKV